MLRILFILLAIVSAVLALVLHQTLLYAVAGGLLLVAFILIIASIRRRQRRNRKAQEPARPDAAGGPRDEELNSLGILEIRPKGAGRPGRAEEPPPEEELSLPTASPMRGAPSPDREPADRSAGADANGMRLVAPPPRVTIKEKQPSVHAVDADAEAPYATVMISYLQALRAALDAQTVCLLRQEEAPLHYHIEAIVSQNAYARSGGSFTTIAPLLNASEARRAVTVRRVGENGIPPANVGYYRDTIAVRQIAMSPVPRHGAPSPYFLLADAMQEGSLGTQHRRTLLAEFAHLLGTIMDMPAQQEPHLEEQLRPRRDIIAEEMEKARAHKRSLALALVYLNQAEARADEGAEVATAAEKALEAHLRKSTRHGRVERFGELTYGIFYTGVVADVEAWATQLQNELDAATGPLEGGISIGIAMLQDRHHDPDAFRADAVEALDDAYQSGTCTIFE